MCELVEAAGISIGSVIKILHEDLYMRKLTAKWVLRFLTIDQKRQLVHDSKSCLDLYNCNPSDFLHQLVIINETWIYHYTSESKQQAKQWVGPGGTAPKRANIQQSAGKVMASVFWDPSSILFIDYLEKNQQRLLLCIIDPIEKINPEKMSLFVEEIMHLFARQCTSSLIDKNDSKNQWMTLWIASPPTLFYKTSPQRGASFYLSLNLKRWLQGQKFSSNEEVE